jgi:hypothetical protein
MKSALWEVLLLDRGTTVLLWTLDLRNVKSPVRHRKPNCEETLAYIQFRLFCAFLYYLGNQTLTRIYLFIYLLFIVYLFIYRLLV